MQGRNILPLTFAFHKLPSSVLHKDNECLYHDNDCVIAWHCLNMCPFGLSE